MPAGAGRIVTVLAARMLDGRGLPALEATIRLQGGAVGRAAVASWGAGGDLATAGYLAALLDGGTASAGQGLDQAIGFVTGEIAKAIDGQDALNSDGLDRMLAELLAGGRRGAEVARAGANATLAVSIASRRAAAQLRGLPLSLLLAPAGLAPRGLPMPVVDIIEADPRHLGLARIALVPLGAERFGDGLDWCGEVLRAAGRALDRMGAPRVVSARGAWVAPFEEPLLAIDFVSRAITQAGLQPGEDVALAIDVAAGRYGSAGGYVVTATGERLDTHGMIARALSWLRRAPIVMLQDALAPDAGAGWPELVRAAGAEVRIVMRDALAGAPQRILQAAEATAAGGVAIVPGQMATLTATLAAGEAARSGGLRICVEAGASETEDAWLAEAAIGLSSDYFAAGGLLGSERVAKWNACQRLAAVLPDKDRIAGGVTGTG